MLQHLEHAKKLLQALDNMLEDKNITRPLYLVAHGFITGQYAVTWALAHPEAVEKLVIMDVPLSSEVCPSPPSNKPCTPKALPAHDVLVPSPHPLAVIAVRPRVE